MKKYVLVTFLMAVVLLFSQCRKPVFPNFNEGENQEVTFTTGGGDEKGDLKPSGATLLKYEWASTDKLYVYGIKNDGTGVGFAGILDEITLYDDNHKAKFHGYVTIPAGSEKLRFVHYGSGVSVDSEGSAISDFTFQDGNLWGTEKSISSRIVSYVDMEINDENVYDCKNKKMDICYAIIKLDLSGFNGNVNVSGIESKGVRINTKGEIGNIAGTFSILEGVSSSSVEYYVALAPKATQTSIVFTNDKLIGELKVGKINSNVYYANTGGAAYTIEAKEMGVLPGLFTVNSEGKTVRFAKGNLTYNQSTSSWGFESEQYSCPKVYDPSRVGHFYWCKGEANAGAYSYNEGSVASIYDIIFTNNTLDTPNPSFKVNGVTGKFRCLSNKIIADGDSELFYLINTRKVKDENGTVQLSYGYGTVEGKKGFFILPDNWNGSVINGFYYGPHLESGSLNYTHNTFSSTTTPTWKQMEDAGVVFLPTAGYAGRVQEYVQCYGESGCYWMSAYCNDKDKTYGLFYNEGAGNPSFCESKQTPYAMRLVIDVVSDGTGSAEGFGSGTW